MVHNIYYKGKVILRIFIIGDWSSTVVKVLCYKSEGRWFDSRGVIGIFHSHNPSDCTMAPGVKSASNRNE
jgi:hypothetical protein